MLCDHFKPNKCPRRQMKGPVIFAITDLWTESRNWLIKTRNSTLTSQYRAEQFLNDLCVSGEFVLSVDWKHKNTYCPKPM